MENCLFCKLISKEIPYVKIREDNNFIALLDLFPNTKGMTLIIPKEHHDSDIFNINSHFYSQYMLAAKKVVKLLKKTLKLHRIAMVIEGMGVNHAHIKLYPMHGVGPEWKEHLSGDPTYFEYYQGYISSKMGPKANLDELNRLGEYIRNHA